MGDLRKILRALEELEEKIGRLYKWFEKLFSHDKEVSVLFSEMSQDETSHRDIIRLQIRRSRENRSLDGKIDVDLDQIKNAIASVDKIINSAPPSLPEALRIAAALEADVSEYYYRNISDADPDIARLIKSLGKADHLHLEKFEKFLQARGYLTPSPSRAGRRQPVTKAAPRSKTKIPGNPKSEKEV